MSVATHNFVNTELIDKTIAAIKRSPHFNMGDWACCIYGHMRKAVGRSPWGAPFHDSPVSTGASMLNVSQETAHALFYGARNRPEAIDLLRRLRDTGSLSASDLRANRPDAGSEPTLDLESASVFERALLPESYQSRRASLVT